MDRRPAKKQKHQKGKPKSDVSVASDFSTASQRAAKFIDSKGFVQIKRLPTKFAGNTADQVARALLENLMGPEAVSR
jgi:hypothetical protein